MRNVTIFTSELGKYQFINEIYQNHNININIDVVLSSMSNLKAQISPNYTDLFIIDSSSEDPYLVYSDIIRSDKSIYFPILFRVKDQDSANKLIEKNIPPINIITVHSDDEQIYPILFIQSLTEKINYYENLYTKFQSDHYSGHLAELSVFDLLYDIEKNNKTGVLKVTNQDRLYSEIFFMNGLIINAEGSFNGTSLTEQKILNEIITVSFHNKTEYEFLADIVSSDKTLSLSVNQVINSYMNSKNYNLITKSNSFSIRNTLVMSQETKNSLMLNSNSTWSGESMENVTNFENVIEIAEDTYWVSHRNPDTLLQTNTYLRVFKGNNGKNINLLVDPGAIEHFPIISSKVSKIAGDISKVQMYSINHQDPDVGMNATFISRINPKSVCLCTEDSWRLVKFFEIPKQSFKNVYSFDNKLTTLSTDQSHTIEFVPTPYCHFVGAFALYDRKNRVLFTGDLFGGLTPTSNLSLVATEDHWEGVKTFHQIYMPSNKAIKNAIDNIRKLDPAPVMIVPQHGSVLAGDIMEQFLNRLYNLEVGSDLFNREDYAKQIPIYIGLMNTIYERFVSFSGMEATERLFQFGDKMQELFHLVDMDANGVKNIFSNPERSFELLLKTISKCKNNMIVNDIKSLAIKESLLLRLPLPANLYSITGTIEDDNDPIFTQDNNVLESTEMFV